MDVTTNNHKIDITDLILLIIQIQLNLVERYKEFKQGNQ